jgi:hypothetical protein
MLKGKYIQPIYEKNKKSTAKVISHFITNKTQNHKTSILEIITSIQVYISETLHHFDIFN